MASVTKTKTNDGREIQGKSLARFVRCSARKARIVMDLIRGKTAGEALEILQFTQRPSAVPYVRRSLLAAIASARETHPQPESLVIGEALVDDAPMIKRIRPASMGRAVRIRKRQCHIQIALTEQED